MIDAIQYLGNDSELLGFTAGNSIVFNSFHRPVIQHPDAASTVVDICDWVFRRKGRLYACPDVLWPVVSELIEQRAQVLALADECAEASEGNCPWSHKARAIYATQTDLRETP